jgi:hypothetical protein
LMMPIALHESVLEGSSTNTQKQQEQYSALIPIHELNMCGRRHA